MTTRPDSVDPQDLSRMEDITDESVHPPTAERHGIYKILFRSVGLAAIAMLLILLIVSFL